MCLNPLLIPNPNLGIKSSKVFKKDTVSQYIPIPCGHCSECMANRAIGLIQRCELEELTGIPFMITLTYSDSMIPKYKLSNGKEITYADFKDLTNMFKRLKKYGAVGRPFRYLAVSERGKKGRPHFHILLFLQRYDGDTAYTYLNLENHLFETFKKAWTRNVGSNKFPDYKPLFEFHSRRLAGKTYSNYDCHYVAPSTLDGSSIGASYYVSKYVMKRDEKTIKLQRYLRLNLPFEEYQKVWSKVKTGMRSSLNFGFGLYNYNAKLVSRIDRFKLLESLPTFEHLSKSISRSIDTQDSPKYFKLSDGKPLPLSRYFYHFDNLYDLRVYNHFKDLSNKFGDFVQIDDRDTLYRLQIDKSKSRKLDKMFVTDITDLI